MRNIGYAIIGIWVFTVLLGFSLSAVAQETESEGTVLNLNFADPEQLEALPGITPEMAQDISANRPYQWFDDLLEIEGVTKDLLVSLEEQIEVSKINVNTAKMNELTHTPGITDDIAHEIIEKRPFEIIEELLQFKGIGEEELAVLKGFFATNPEEIEEDSKKGWQPRKQNMPLP